MVGNWYRRRTILNVRLLEMQNKSLVVSVVFEEIQMTDQIGILEDENSH